jgi:hydrogenase nickel insertion protein HypA
MHELSIANEIFKIVQSHAPQGEVTAVGIRLGAWSCVQEDSLRNSFRWVTDQTLYCDVHLEIERIEEIWICNACQQSFDQGKQTGNGPENCPWCGDPLSLLDGVQEMRVEWIELHGKQET